MATCEAQPDPDPATSEPPASSPDAVEDALARALTAATAAQQWAVVAQLAGELQARREARASNVVPLRRRATSEG